MKALVLSLIALSAASAIGSQALANDLTVTVNDAAGKPVAYAVVTYMPAGGAVIPPALKSAPYVMAQKNIQFQPFVLAVPEGATVAFPNQDKVNHHVYSFSPTQPFQLPLYGRGQTRTVTFVKAGTEALGCNIHDSMAAYIRVVATPFFATTDAGGRAVLTNIPDGSGSLKVWQPLMETSDHETGRDLTVNRTTPPQTFSVKVRQMMTMTGSY